MAGDKPDVFELWGVLRGKRKHEDFISKSQTAGHKRRSTSAPPAEHKHRPHAQHLLSEFQWAINVSQCKISKGDKGQEVPSPRPGSCPPGPSKRSIDWVTKNNVEVLHSKMLDTLTNKSRKRKHHQHSSDFSRPIALEEITDSPSSPTPEEIIDSASPSNIENEGVATNSKRIKLNPIESRTHYHSSEFRSTSYPSHPSTGDLEVCPKDRKVHTKPSNVDVDAEAEKQRKVCGKRNVAKEGVSGWESSGWYKGTSNNLNDYGYTPHNSCSTHLKAPITDHASRSRIVPNAISIAPVKNKMVGNEKKTAGVLGVFRPHNSLGRSASSPSPVFRPAHKKTFDLNEGVFNTQTEDDRAPKRQKLGPEKLPRRESPNSAIEVSREGVHTDVACCSSPTASTPVKSVQSVGSRSRRQKTNLITLGSVEAYRKVESMVVLDRRRLKALTDELEGRRSSQEAGNASGSPQLHSAFRGKRSISPPTGTQPCGANDGPEPILIDEADADEIEEVSPEPKGYQPTAKIVPPKSKVSMSGASQKKVSQRALATPEDSPYFANYGKRGGADICVTQGSLSNGLPADMIGSSGQATRTSSSDSEQHDNAVDRVNYVEEDSIDLVDLEDEDQRPVFEIKPHLSNSKLMKSFSRPKSQSICDKGDIPRSTLAAKTPTSSLQTRRKSNSSLIFNITYIRSGDKHIRLAEDVDPWQLEYNYNTKLFDVVASGESVSDLYPSLVLKPQKIRRVTFHEDSAKVVILRATESDITAPAKLLVELDTSSGGADFAKCLRDMNGTLKFCRSDTSEYLDKIFMREAEHFTSKKMLLTVKEKPDDITLMEAREARRATAQKRTRATFAAPLKISTLEQEQNENIGRRLSSISYEHALSNRTRGKSLVEKMTTKPPDEALQSSLAPRADLVEDTEVSGSRRINARNAWDLSGSRPATRASVGQQNRARELRSPKPRSPDPPRWTQENPHWEKDRGWRTSLVFPAEGKKKATVDARDVERLDEGEFLNDNLIAFYLRYLEDCLEKSHPELANRIYFQNTFFYENLTKGKVRSNNINYDAVKRWTAKVNLFSYDYIIVPVCEKLHWYLAIICNAPRLLPWNMAEERKSQYGDESAMANVAPKPDSPPEDAEDKLEAFEMPDNGEEAIGPAQPLSPVRTTSASPSVTARVEHMSLEDGNDEWPEPDAVPERLQPAAESGQGNSPSATDQEFERDVSAGKDRSGDVPHKVKKPKRKSIPTPRKYDSSDPRIITLDSLGGTHSPTCSNLREYLVCEAKERHGVSILAGRLGMTAKGLPQQSNYCDCGVFVLGYIEKFLKNPDAFVHGILQGEMAENKEWPETEAPKTRERIRNLIFELHAEQTQKEKDQREAKSRIKKASKLDAHSSSRKPSDSGPQVTRTTSPKARTPVNPRSGIPASEGLEQPIWSQPKLADGHGIEQASSQTPRMREVSSQAAKGDRTPDLIDRIIAKRRENSAENAITRVTRSQDMELIESPILDFEWDVARARKGSPSVETTPVRSQEHGRESSTKLDSPLNLTESRSYWHEPLACEPAESSNRLNTFKQFAKDLTSPYQNTRHRTRQVGASEDSLMEINDSDSDNQSPLHETTPRQKQMENSFDDIMELPGKSTPSPSSSRRRRGSAAPCLASSPTTPTRVSSRVAKSSPRNQYRKSASPYMLRSEH